MRSRASKLTDVQLDVIQLIDRTPDRGDNWRNISSKVFDKLIKPMPKELVEIDESTDPQRARLTDAGRILLEWF